MPDTFHEVKKRRDKKKENSDDIGQVETRRCNDYIDQGPSFYFDRNGQRGRSAGNGISREFGVAQGNKVDQSYSGETKSSTQATLSGMARRIYNVSNIPSHVASNNQRYSSSRNAHKSITGNDFRPKAALDFNYNSRKDLQERNTSASSRAVGVYASSSDPEHLPYSDCRSRAAVRTIRGDTGVSGDYGSQSSKRGLKQTHHQNVSNLSSVLRSSYAKGSFKQFNTISQSDQNPRMAVKSVLSIPARNRSNNHYGNRFSQQPTVRTVPKGVVPRKAWKPKTNPRPNFPSRGAIRSPMRSNSRQFYTSKNVKRETSELEDKLSQINIHDSQRVAVAHDIQIPEEIRSRLIFGSFGLKSESTDALAPAFKWADDVEEADGAESVDGSPSNIQVNALDDKVRKSASSSSSGVSMENSLPSNINSDGGCNNENYTDMNSVHNCSSYATSRSEQLQESTGLPNLSVLSLQSGNSVPNTSLSSMQQQTPIPQMYSQLQLPHFTDIMPYNQYLAPMFVPPIIPGGYSSSPGYPHLFSDSSYVMMPGGGSHLSADVLKYGVQQFNSFPTSNPTESGGLASPAEYVVNAAGGVGPPAGLEESSRPNYKDNLHAPNPLVETSEVWVQNHKEISGMLMAPYLTMPGQATHSAYMQHHTTHPSFIPAITQPSQMPFLGMYPPQPAAHPNNNHLGSGNIGVGLATRPTGAQLGNFQQP